MLAHCLLISCCPSIAKCISSLCIRFFLLFSFIHSTHPRNRSPIQKSLRSGSHRTASNSKPLGSSCVEPISIATISIIYYRPPHNVIECWSILVTMALLHLVLLPILLCTRRRDSFNLTVSSPLLSLAEGFRAMRLKEIEIDYDDSITIGFRFFFSTFGTDRQIHYIRSGMARVCYQSRIFVKPDAIVSHGLRPVPQLKLCRFDSSNGTPRYKVIY